ncbi:MAG TPA: type II toxin-antitoxin system RelE/ParE family toxin [Blastocatellia bacterium]|nr:type II toxin-antitoxin system RelE/ParE family toxin [Blastocatellia bacterium]
MDRDKLLGVVFFCTGGGTEPAREWLRKLTRDDKVNIGRDILAVQKAWPVGKPLVDYLGDGIWEVRSSLKDRIARVLFMIDGNEMVILHGFIKKDQRTPKPDLDLAKRKKKQYEG